MASSPNEIAFDASPLLIIYKDGRIERLMGTDLTPPSLDLETGVESKDILISPETGVSARIYKPKTTTQKLPLLVYFHGGAFCIETAFSPTYHRHLNNLTAQAKAITVSIDYRRAPEHPLPIAYEDSWAALKWVAAHSSGSGEEQWLNDLVDFERVYFAGDSAGANIAHRMGLRVGSAGLIGSKLRGLILVHPYFWGGELVGGEEKIEAVVRSAIENLWRLACPNGSGLDDPMINPRCDEELGGLGGERVMVCVAEKDALRERGLLYGEGLRKVGWGGVVKVVETKGEGHVFHLMNPGSEAAVGLTGKFAAFINGDR